MSIFAFLIHWVVEFYIMAIIVQVAMHWLIAFDVINTKNKQAQKVMDFLDMITEPLYKPVRKYIPAVGGFDLSPVVLIIGLSLIRNVLIGLLI